MTEILRQSRHGLYPPLHTVILCSVACHFCHCFQAEYFMSTKQAFSPVLQVLILNIPEGSTMEARKNPGSSLGYSVAEEPLALSS